MGLFGNHREPRELSHYPVERFHFDESGCSRTIRIVDPNPEGDGAVFADANVEDQLLRNIVAAKEVYVSLKSDATGKRTRCDNRDDYAVLDEFRNIGVPDGI